MFVRSKSARVFSVAAVGALVWSGLGVASPAQAVDWTCAAVRSATWGSGQVCKGSDFTWKMRSRDDATDGYCVEGYYYSQDSMSYRRTSPRSQECNGVWKETIIGTVPWQNGVRLVRGDGRYLTMALPPR